MIPEDIPKPPDCPKCNNCGEIVAETLSVRPYELLCDCEWGKRIAKAEEAARAKRGIL